MVISASLAPRITQLVLAPGQQSPIPLGGRVGREGGREVREAGRQVRVQEGARGEKGGGGQNDTKKIRIS